MMTKLVNAFSWRRLCSFLFLVSSLFLLSNCGGGGGGTDDDTSSTTTVPTITPSTGMDLYGFVGDADNNPISGVVVTDGYQCVQTDSKGVYQMKRNANAEYVYYSVPSEYKVNTHSTTDNTATFYSKLSTGTNRYDFKLTKLSTGAETNFTVIAIGDPQVSTRTTDPYYTTSGVSSSSTNLNRLKNETMTDIASTISGISTPVYGISMGDDVDTGAYSLQTSVRNVLGSTSMTVFSVIGNHDQVTTTTASYDAAGVSSFKAAWGPVNYSFNRGNVHFVALNNVIFDSSLSDGYTGGFTDEQLAWLKQDLSFVPKTMMVVLCYHIPMRNTTSYKNRNNVFALLQGYANYSLFCGHTHYNEVCSVSTTISTVEHIHAAACGAWWKSTLNTEGTPDGYAVYTVSGTKFTDWYYKSVSRPRSFQMRLCKEDQLFGGSYGYYSYSGLLSLTANAGYVVANIFNADDNWTIKAYEGSSTTGVAMTKAPTQADAYAVGYHVGVLGRTYANYDGGSKHTYYYKPTDPNAEVTVKATDEFGNTYTANTFVTDFSEAMHY